MDISNSTISRITDKILPIVKEWRERPLEEVYAGVFMDASNYHVRSEGRIVKRVVYLIFGIDMNGKGISLACMLVKTKVQSLFHTKTSKNRWLI